ncbi:MAG TPA: TolC family protein [Bryobacteraceae bacterium]|nr:TolC family protein [Bryobacteraceae bacterium]
MPNLPSLVLAVCAAMSAQSQQPATRQAMSLLEAVEAALERYPAVRMSEAQVREAAAGIQLARTAYLPKLDGIAGLNRASRNNVLGLLLPSQVIAPVTGPVLNTNSLASVWGSTVGALVTWEPFDFGLRGANVDLAEATRARASAGVARTRLEVATLTADTFLTLVAAQQTVVAAQAALERSGELERITDALVRSELRPGAEFSLAQAEQASARAQLIRARQAVAEAKASLAALTGVEVTAIEVRPGRLLDMPASSDSLHDVLRNPAALEQQAVISEAEVRVRVLDRSYFPRFSLQGTSYARGTGALPEGQLLQGVNGLGPNIHNWGVGFTATFPVFELPSIRARRTMENARVDAERGRYEQIVVDLKSRQGVARAAYEGAIQVAETTPVGIGAARSAVSQARARYQAGLATALDVADAQRRLSQAEIDDSLARLNVWRARAALYAAQGDISALLSEASQ